MTGPRCICESACELGEGIFWDPGRQRLFWFDIARLQLLSCRADGGEPTCVPLARQASAAMLTDTGAFVIAADTGSGHYDPDIDQFSDWQPLPDEPKTHRTNDGRGDPHGAFWFGTMPKDGNGSGSIYRRSPQGEVRRVIPEVATPNAIAFSPQGDVMYWADSPKRIIWRCPLSADGTLGEREVFVSLEGQPQVPDGAVTDAEGFLWNAEWDGWRVVRYNPDGGVDRVIELPVARPTCPALGGERGESVYVSSAREGLPAAELDKQPLAGGVFAFDAPA